MQRRKLAPEGEPGRAELVSEGEGHGRREEPWKGSATESQSLGGLVREAMG